MRGTELPLDAIHPTQFANPPVVDRGHRLLVAAVLERAFCDLQGQSGLPPGPRSTRESRQTRALREVQFWFASDDRSWPLSFVNCCTHLDLDPELIRRAIGARGISLTIRRLRGAA